MKPRIKGAYIIMGAYKYLMWSGDNGAWWFFGVDYAIRNSN